MLDKLFKKEKKQQELIKLASMTEEEVEKLYYKGKQKHYAAKSKICTVFHNSKDGTYIKPKENENE